MANALQQAGREPLQLTLGKFFLSETGLEVRGDPTFDEWQDVGTFIKRTNRAAGFWLADWLRYGDGRADWRERLSQAVDAGELSKQTLVNVRAVGRIDPKRRRPGVDFSHHVEVAGLAPDEQEEWLERAETEGMSVRELRQGIRASRRRKVISGRAVLEGFYRVFYADPPWQYRDAGATADGSLAKAERHYKTMSIEDLCKLPVADHALKDAVLFLWVTAPLLLQNPGPREVIEAWGFEAKTGLVWDKILGVGGHYVYVQHEHLIICTRGSCTPDVTVPQPHSVFTEKRSKQHSAKPAGIRQMIKRMYTRGPYVELFASERVEGWDVFGDDARLGDAGKGD